MPVTLPVAAAAQAPASAPRSGAETTGAVADSGSFADTMQAQESPAAGGESPPAPKAAPEATAARRSRERATAAIDDAGASRSEENPDATLDPSQIDTMLGLCEGEGAAESAVSPSGEPSLRSDALDSGNCVAPPAIAALTLPIAPSSEAASAAPASGRDGLETGLGALDGLRATATAAQAAGAGELASRLEASLDEGEEAASGRDAPAPGAGAAALDPRGTTAARLTEAQAAARAPEMRAPLGTPAWTDELGSRVTWMLDQGEQVASLRLSPENLGPLDVRIAVREGETTVWFGAAHPETRAALEQSLPRLREMLGAAGLALANAGVFSQTPRDPQRGFTAAALARAAVEGGADGTLANVNGVTHRGLVDLYA